MRIRNIQKKRLKGSRRNPPNKSANLKYDHCLSENRRQLKRNGGRVFRCFFSVDKEFCTSLYFLQIMMKVFVRAVAIKTTGDSQEIHQPKRQRPVFSAERPQFPYWPFPTEPPDHWIQIVSDRKRAEEVKSEKCLIDSAPVSRRSIRENCSDARNARKTYDSLTSPNSTADISTPNISFYLVAVRSGTGWPFFSGIEGIQPHSEHRAA
jgi:hypothetical protein